MLKVILENQRKLSTTSGDLVVICDQNGVALVIASQLGENVEILTAADGDVFKQRISLITKRAKGSVVEPTTITAYKDK